MEQSTTPTLAQIDAWKKEYKEVHLIEVEELETELDPYRLGDEVNSETSVKGYLKAPDDKVMNAALTKLPMFLEAGKVILINCWLGGDERLLKDNGFMNAAAMQAAQLVKIRAGRLKKI
jgi:hypothetical protein